MVCKALDDKVNQIVNGKFKEHLLISAGSLRHIKFVARTADLAFLQSPFLAKLTKLFGPSTGPGTTFRALLRVLDHCPEEDVFRLALQDYRKFLVIKSIESIARARPNPKHTRWVKQCKPTLVVDLLWRIHIEFSDEYSSTCEALCGKTLARSWSKKKDPIHAQRGSSVEDKLRYIFKRENRGKKRNPQFATVTDIFRRKGEHAFAGYVDLYDDSFDPEYNSESEKWRGDEDDEDEEDVPWDDVVTAEYFQSSSNTETFAMIYGAHS